MWAYLVCFSLRHLLLNIHRVSYWIPLAIGPDITLRYYNIDTPGLLESTDPHTYLSSYDFSILIEDPKISSRPLNTLFFCRILSILAYSSNVKFEHVGRSRI